MSVYKDTVLELSSAVFVTLNFDFCLFSIKELCTHILWQNSS